MPRGLGQPTHHDASRTRFEPTQRGCQAETESATHTHGLIGRTGCSPPKELLWRQKFSPQEGEQGAKGFDTERTDKDVRREIDGVRMRLRSM